MSNRMIIRGSILPYVEIPNNSLYRMSMEENRPVTSHIIWEGSHKLAFQSKEGWQVCQIEYPLINHTTIKPMQALYLLKPEDEIQFMCTATLLQARPDWVATETLLLAELGAFLKDLSKRKLRYPVFAEYMYDLAQQHTDVVADPKAWFLSKF